MKLAIVPGSFDPMTLGHLDLIKKAAQRYDEVVVALMINPAKQYLFDLPMRMEIAKRTVADLPNVRVISDRGMLIDLFDRLGAFTVCKGWRDDADFAYETKMADWNRSHNSNFRTELIHSKGINATVSSTQVRSILLSGESPAEWVHPDALPLILTKRREK